MPCAPNVFISARFLEEKRYETEGAWAVKREGCWVPASAGEAGAEYIAYRSIYPKIQKFLIEWCGYEFDEEAQDIGYWANSAEG